MNKTPFSRWHCLVIDAEYPDDGMQLMHPASCRWSVEFQPPTMGQYGDVVDPGGWTQRYTCDVGRDLEEWGDFGDRTPTEPGFYWIRLEHIVYPGGPWGSTEYDTGVEWHVVRRPNYIIRPDHDPEDQLRLDLTAPGA